MPIKEILIRNTIFREKPVEPRFSPSYEVQKGSLLERLHSSRNLIQEKAFGNISSFNFNRDVFNSGKWNDLTTKARGLFLDNTTGRIVARGFEKFFGYKEQRFMPDSLIKIKAQAFIRSNGKYEDPIDQWFEKHELERNPDLVQIHAHRNTSSVPIKASKNSYNLCDEVEFGGNLRIIEISHD